MALKIGSISAMAVILTACATGSGYEMSEEVAATLAGFERTGETDTCLPLRSIDQIKPLDDRNLLIEMRNGDFYLNEPSSRCGGARDIGTYIEYRTTLSSLCRNEIIRIVDNSTGFTVGSCGLGEFHELVEISEDDS